MRCERKLSFFGIATKKQCPGTVSKEVTVFYGGIPTKKFLCEGCADYHVNNVKARGGTVSIEPFNEEQKNVRLD